MRRAMTVSVLAAVALSGCASMPSGPTVPVMPAQGKPLAQFQQDDGYCRGYAAQQNGGRSPTQVANQTGVGDAVVGTVVGGAAGAAIGAAAGNPALGAAIGAGTGLVAGSSVGAANAQATGYGAQRAYDIAYAQCMTAQGNKVPANAFDAPAVAYGYGAPYPYAAAYPYDPYWGPYGYGPWYGPGISVGFGWGGGWGHRGHWR